MNDLIRLACERACQEYATIDGNYGSKRTFNGACFAQVFASFSGTTNVLDGRVVRAMLTGRDDIEVLPGGCHYKIRRG